jgi:hypothetical protein
LDQGLLRLATLASLMVTDDNTREKTTGPEKMRRLERVVLGVEDPPWNALYRTAIGFVMFPVVSRIWGEGVSGWVLAAFLLGILGMLRVAPVMVRKLVPFSDSVKAIWTSRRRLAKLYDSYQWRKLFWFGAGLAAYAAVSGQLSTSRIIICATCLLSGAVGLARWRIASTRLASPTCRRHGERTA